MLGILFVILIVLVAVVLIGALITAPFVLIFVKPSNCPSCDRKARFFTKSVKCPHCKAKLFKHANGSYMVRN